MSFGSTPLVTAKANGLASGTSAAVDTTGAKLFVIQAAFSGACAISDSKGNTWTAGTLFNGSTPNVQFFYCISPTVGAGHTFTITASVGALVMSAWSCTQTPAVDSQSTPNQTSSTQGQFGATSFTPAAAGCLLFAGTSFAGAITGWAAGAGWTAVDFQPYVGSTSYGTGVTYKQQTAATAVPTTEATATWSSGATNVSFNGIAFKEVAAASITVTDPVDGSGVQRSTGMGTSSGVGSLAIAGTATATTGIEARVVLHGTSTEVLTWTSVKGAHAGGGFTGTLANIPAGGWYNVQVRLANAPGTVANGANRWGVGAFVGVIGQSLAQRMSSDGTSVSPNARLAQYSGSAGTAWALRTSTGTAANTLGNSIIAALGGSVPVWILNYGVGGTALIQAGDTGGNGYWLSTAGGSPYALFLAGLTSAGGKLEAVYWDQGQQDGYSNAVSEATYGAGLTTLFARIRTDTGQASLPIIISPLGRYTDPGPTAASWEGIRRAQVTAGGAANNYLAAFNQDLTLTDYVHLDDAGAVKQGTRGARAFKAAYGLSAYVRGPAIASAVKTSSTSVEVVLAHRGGTDFTPSSGITGFTITGGAAPAISAAVRTNATKITLTLATALTGGESLRYQYGATPAVTNPVRDDTADTLPLGLESGQALLITVPDVTAPVPTNPTGTATGTTTATGTVDLNEATGTLYYYRSTNASETGTTVKASGQTQNVTSTGTKNVNLTGLTPSTGYHLHYLHRDAAGNDSVVVSSPLFTTSGNPRATVPLFEDDGTTPIADQSGVAWGWYDAYPPNMATAPAVSGTASISGGELDVSLAGTALSIGQVGTLIALKGNGTPGSVVNRAIVIPWAVNA